MSKVLLVDLATRTKLKNGIRSRLHAHLARAGPRPQVAFDSALVASLTFHSEPTHLLT